MELLAEHKALLGSKATASLSKITGVVAAIVYNLASSPHAYVQPPLKKDGSVPNAYLLDLHMCTFTGKITTKKLPEIETSSINNGDKVEDLVTGFVGTVTSISFGYNGCCEIMAVSRVDKENKSGKSILLNCKRWKVVEQGWVTIEGAETMPTSNKGTAYLVTAPHCSA